MGETQVIKNLLFSTKRLHRDSGESELDKLDKNQELVEFVASLLSQLQNANEHTAWAEIHGCLLGIKCVLNKYNFNESSSFDEEKIRLEALKNLQHPELRVRKMAGLLLGVLCKITQGKTYTLSKRHLLQLLESDLERKGQEDPSEDFDDNASISSKVSDFTAKELLHQSMGWRHLETSIKCLHVMITGCGNHFENQLDKDLVFFLFKALKHENRFVRETGFYVFAELFISKLRIEQNKMLNEISGNIAEQISLGLADNWSQVRLASSNVARSFMINFPNAKDHFKLLLPRLCLNRYYIADGVRIFTQKTWQEICGSRGKSLVEEHIDAVVEYYVQATQANNHAVREAACHCIAELACKVDVEKSRPHVASLVKALLDCFHDDSWPVRDAACVSCGNFLLEFYQECLPHRSELYKLYLANLQDPIASVRAGAAISLGKYCKVYGNELIDEVVEEVKQGFIFIEKQEADSENFVGLDKKPAVFGVVKNVEDPKHTNQIMYSCGSLAPKMGRGGNRDKLGGCTSCDFKRPSKPWERSDGCVYFLVELAKHYPTQAIDLVPYMVKATTYKHFPQHVVFHETICNQLPIFASIVGKRAFKTHLESLFDLIFYSLDSDIPLTSVAAENCLLQLSKFLGQGILRGRIEMWNTGKLVKYDKLFH